MDRELKVEKLFPDERMFERGFWESCKRNELRDLIMKFASAENFERDRDSTKDWKGFRKESAKVFLERFGSVPKVLEADELPNPFGSILFDQELNNLWES